MGKHQALHLMNNGYQLYVYNRTQAKAQELLDKGAQWKSPKEIAEEVDYLFLMLGYPRDVEDMVLGEAGILKHMKKGAFLIDHTTSTPHLATRIAEAA